MADYKLLAVLATGKPGVPSASNYGLITKLKVGNVTLEGDTVDGVDVAQLSTDFGTHDGASAYAAHGNDVGGHTHQSAGAQGGKLDHGAALDGLTDDDHNIYVLATGARAFSGTVTGVTPTSDGHLATKGYVDSMAEGLPNKYSCRVRAQGNINISAPGASIDGVTMASGQRFLADQQSTGSEDGIYKWQGAATPAVRADDFPTGFNARGSYCFIEEGTDADVGVVCTNDTGSDVVGTDDLTMIRFSKATDFSAGTGLTKTATTVNAIGGDGIVANADDLAVDLDASIPGLEIASSKLRVKAKAAAGIEVDASGVGIKIESSSPSLQFASNELGIKFDGSGGLQKAAGGTGIKLSGTTLQLAAGGVSVKGLGSLFEIATVAVSANVTAANLTELTGGGTTSLHTHTFGAHKDSHKSGGGDAFVKGDSLIASARYLDDIADPASDAQRIWIEDATANLKYWDDQGTPVKQTVERQENREAASGYAGLDGSSKVIKDPANATATPTASKIPIADGSGKLAAGWLQEVLAYADLTDDPLGTHEAVKAANAVLGHVIVEDASKIDVDGSGKLTLGTHASTHQDGGTDEVGDSTPAADTILKSEADGKMAFGWIDTSDIEGNAFTFSANQHFNGETTVDELIGDGDYAGIQIPRTVGTGGITAGDILTFDGTGQIIRRTGADQIMVGVACTTTAASSTGYYMPIGVGKALFTSGDEPSTPGENVFVDNTPGNYHKLTTDVQTDGIVYSFVALETGALAKVMILPRRVFGFE